MPAFGPCGGGFKPAGLILAPDGGGLKPTGGAAGCRGRTCPPTPRAAVGGGAGKVLFDAQDYPDDAWQWIIDLNVTSTLLPTQAAVKAMRKQYAGARTDIQTRMTQISKYSDLKGHLVFIENYDIHVARQMVSGCDIWMNNPRRPLEASGTSGMKASCHGGMNMSILDGWWREGYDGTNGFAVGDDAGTRSGPTWPPTR